MERHIVADQCNKTDSDDCRHLRPVTIHKGVSLYHWYADRNQCRERCEYDDKTLLKASTISFVPRARKLPSTAANPQVVAHAGAEVRELNMPL
jgi:hypothetical protein